MSKYQRKKAAKTVQAKVERALSKMDESSSEDETPKICDFEDNEYDIPSKKATFLNKRNVQLLSEQSSRYKGEESSRNIVYSSDESVQTEDEMQENDGNEDEDDSSESNENDSNENEADSDSFQEDDDDQEEEEDDDQEELDDNDNDDTEPLTRDNLISEAQIQDEIKKGQCVKNQLRIWERLLELRIGMQKVLNNGNKLPNPTAFHEMKATSDEFSVLSSEVSSNAAKLLSNLMELKRCLYLQNSELSQRQRASLKRPCPFSDNIPAYKEAVSDQLSEQFTEFRQYRNEILLKWDDRVKLLTINSKTKSDTQKYDIVKKIEYTLRHRKTTAKNSKSDNNMDEEKTTNNEHNPNIYDDSDFYHELLREFIEYKSNNALGVSDATEKVADLEKLRQKTKRNNVDVKATKGRKLRYAVHNKLINFMAPSAGSNWTDAAINELTKSLFT